MVDIWDSYYKFTVVRNPFSKLISAWFHFHRTQATGRTSINSTSGDRANPSLHVRKDAITDFRSWIGSGGATIDRNKYLIDGEVCVDFFIRFETLQADIENVNSRLDTHQPDRALPTFKSSTWSERYEVSDFYDDATERIARDRYAWEFEHFQYEMPTQHRVAT